jgi:hypothetical protein
MSHHKSERAQDYSSVGERVSELLLMPLRAKVIKALASQLLCENDLLISSRIPDLI